MRPVEICLIRKFAARRGIAVNKLPMSDVVEGSLEQICQTPCSPRQLREDVTVKRNAILSHFSLTNTV